jgi:hypothetical protein
LSFYHQSRRQPPRSLCRSTKTPERRSAVRLVTLSPLSGKKPCQLVHHGFSPFQAPCFGTLQHVVSRHSPTPPHLSLDNICNAWLIEPKRKWGAALENTSRPWLRCDTARHYQQHTSRTSLGQDIKKCRPANYGRMEANRWVTRVMTSRTRLRRLPIS